MASLSPLARDMLHYSTTPDVISPLTCGLNCHVKAAMNTIKGCAFVLRHRPLPPPQRSIPAYKRHPPLPGPLHTLGHHSFALFPSFHELPPATSLPILPRPPHPTLWCVLCSINHRGRFSMSRSPSPDHSSDRRLDEAPPPPSTDDHHRAVSSPGRPPSGEARNEFPNSPSCFRPTRGDPLATGAQFWSVSGDPAAV
jgi:hypothetical protein